MKPHSIVLLAIASALFFSSCRRGAVERVIERRVLMGTEVTITAWDRHKPTTEVASAVKESFRSMEALERLLTRHDKESELSQLNAQAGSGPVKVGPELLRILQRAQEVWETSQGAFDPTVGPLVALWIRAAKADRLPGKKEIQSALTRVGFGRVQVDGEGGTVALPAGFSLDLGGIAKGYIVDEGARGLRKAGIGNVLVEAGGDLAAFGKRPDGTPWRVGIQNPEEGGESGAGLVGVLGISGRGVTTSGHYRRFSVIQGKKYSHILDPLTGIPVRPSVLSVTVVAPNATQADGLSTAVAVLGADRGLAVIHKVPGVEVFIIRRDERGRIGILESAGMSSYFVR
ncbi:MAG: FAD:protein FMN transferase [Planctomycetota bacterium]|jgi:thiamine biosynthesis lipoprotein